MSRNYIFQSIWILVFAVVLVGVFPLIQGEFDFLSDNFRSYSYLEAIQADEGELAEGLEEDCQEEPLAKADTLEEVVEEEVLPFENYTGIKALIPFFESLNAIVKKKGKVRVAYFGDSMIEGDLVSQTLRSELQKKFGGKGVGFVPVVSQTNFFRVSVRHTYSDNWSYGNFTVTDSPLHKFGISGEYSTGPVQSESEYEEAWVEYRGSNYYHGLTPFETVRMFYGKTRAPDTLVEDENVVRPLDSLILETENAEKAFALDDEYLVNELLLTESSVKKLNARFKVNENLPLYGFSFESEEGIHLDCFSSRGNSGLGLSLITTEMYRQFQELLDYDLLILHYGLNVINPKVTNYGWYERSMERVLDHVKDAFPGIPILLISVTDRSIKEEEEIVTDPSIPYFIDVQKKIAYNKEVAFFNLYDAMGGQGTMEAWAEADPPLANKDYTHPNFRGARKLSGFIYEFLMSEYEHFNEKEWLKKVDSTLPVQLFPVQFPEMD